MTESAGGVPPDLSHLLVGVEDLQPFPGNARRGDVDALAESLTVNGQYRPVIYQRSTGYVLSGNHTYAAARRLGWRTLAAVGVDVDDDQAARIVLVDNRTADLGTTDDLLALQLLEEVGLTGTGYDKRALAALLATQQPPTWQEFGPDAADDLDVQTCPQCGRRFAA